MKRFKKLLIVFDIDGTIANPRNRFKYHKKPASDRSNKFYRVWLHKVQKTLIKDHPIKPLRDLLQYLEGLDIVGRGNVIYCTSREEIYRKVTEQWLNKHKFPHFPLIMRKNGDINPAHIMKSKYLKQHYKNWQIIVIDDDTCGKLSKICKQNKWVHLKPTTSGTVP